MRKLKSWKIFENYSEAKSLVDDVRDILVDLEDEGIPVIVACGKAPNYQPGKSSFPFSSDPLSVHYLPHNNLCVILENHRLELGFGVNDVKIDTHKFSTHFEELISYLAERGWKIDRFYFEQEGKTVWYADFGTGRDNLPGHLLNLGTTNWIKILFLKD